MLAVSPSDYFNKIPDSNPLREEGFYFGAPREQGIRVGRMALVVVAEAGSHLLLLSIRKQSRNRKWHGATDMAAGPQQSTLPSEAPSLMCATPQTPPH